MRASIPSQTVRHVALLLAISALTFFLNLGTPRLWDRDEPRNAGATLEMLRRGDWIVPVFNDELRVHKPVLINWFMMSAYAVFDDPEFAARFWSAALGLGTVLMTYVIGRRLFNASAGLWAGVVLASNLQFAMMARAATPRKWARPCHSIASTSTSRIQASCTRAVGCSVWPDRSRSR